MQVQHRLPFVLKVLLHAGLTRARDSIGRASAVGLSAAEVNAAPRIIRLIADAMEKVDAPAKRVDILYLVDSILQVGRSSRSLPTCLNMMCVHAAQRLIVA